MTWDIRHGRQPVKVLQNNDEWWSQPIHSLAHGGNGILLSASIKGGWMWNEGKGWSGSAQGIFTKRN